MRLFVAAVGQRLPAWADSAWEEFARRFPPELRLALRSPHAEPLACRSAAQSMHADRHGLEAALPRAAPREVLAARGDRLNLDRQPH